MRVDQGVSAGRGKHKADKRSEERPSGENGRAQQVPVSNCKSNSTGVWGLG